MISNCPNLTMFICPHQFIFFQQFMINSLRNIFYPLIGVSKSHYIGLQPCSGRIDVIQQIVIPVPIQGYNLYLHTL